MRPFESFQDKVPFPSFVHDNSPKLIDLTGLVPGEARLVTVEIYTPTAGNVGLWPYNTVHAQGVFTHTTQNGQSETITMRLTDGPDKFIVAIAQQADSEFSVIAAWGGPAVIPFQPTFPIATGWTTGNSETWREYDLTSWIGTVDPNHSGHVEAVICYLRYGINSDANARPNGSTWSLPGSPPTVNVRGDTVVRVDENNIIEIYEGDDGAKTPVQNSWVYFVGYILKGAYTNWDDETFYSYKALPNPTDDVVFTSGDTWDTYNIAGHTVSSNVVGAYWRMQNYGGSNVATYAREVGSANPTHSGTTTSRPIPGFPLDVDANGDVEFNMQAANTESWLFGYVEEHIKQPHVTVTEL